MKQTLKKILKAIMPYGVLYLLRKVRRRRLMEKQRVASGCSAPVNSGLAAASDTTSGVTAISYNIVNYCNSRCVMCNIWEERPQKPLSIQEFKKVISDPIFVNLQFLSFVGGEPTLAPNLEGYFETALKTLPGLTGVGITTNALNTDKLKDTVKKAAAICSKYRKRFVLQLSVDGYGETHDLNRGCAGSFEKIPALIEWLRHEGITFSMAATITKVNVWGMDRYLSFLRKNNLYSRFRVASFLNRLKNNDNTGMIRNFDADEIYQLMLFFYKLQLSYETNDHIKSLYASHRNVISGGERIVDCTYVDKKWAVLDYNGDLYCCSVKSEIKGNLLEESGESIFSRSYQEIPEIVKKHCPSCIHDCSAGIPSEKQIKATQDEQKYRELFTVQKYFELRWRDPVDIGKIIYDGRYTIFITGWYGTETVGDKAILGGIVDECKARLGGVRIMISSLYPFVTERTIYELGIEAEVVPVYSADFFRAAASADETIVGGGPLMELEELSLIQWAFYLAKKYGKKTKVYGCGVGPLFTDGKKSAVSEIFFLSDEIYLRDEQSRLMAEAMAPAGKKCVNIGDPAVAYIKKAADGVKVSQSENKVSFFLRELSYHEYFKHLSWDGFAVLKERFERGLAENIKRLHAEKGLLPHFYAMNNFVVGADDRDFNFYFVDKYLSDMETYVDNKLSTINSVVEQMLSSQLNVCMRYHSVVFAHTLGTKFAAIDYTSGGKVLGYMRDNVPDSLPFTLEQLACEPKCLYNAL